MKLPADHTNDAHLPLSGHTKSIDQLYKDWFLDYASYVVLARAIPAIEDGLKPVQRLLLHAMHLLEDGRYNKVSNITGQTMQFHPHGDAPITEALIQLGQKKLLIDTQGNWGDPRTGDRAAAGRYIEARLTPFAAKVLYSDQITKWEPSYDNRKKQPKRLPVKFPILLFQGAEGIAVGLSTRILPHNFIELLDACINCLKGEPVQLYPDFPSGGMADCSLYQGGMPGGRVRVRATIEQVTPTQLVVRELPYGQTTASVIESILKANQQGKLGCKRVIDRTAQSVAIHIDLLPNQDPTQAVQALYCFTNCEVVLSTQACVIIDEKPCFLPVEKILERQVNYTKQWLGEELLYEITILKEKIIKQQLKHYFITHQVYDLLKTAPSWQESLLQIKERMAAYAKSIGHALTKEDLAALTELPIRQISHFDQTKNKKQKDKWVAELMIKQEQYTHLTAYTIAYYRQLKKRFGGDALKRRTSLQAFDAIKRQTLLPRLLSLHADYATGFLGYKANHAGALVGKCNKLDKVLLVFKNGSVQLIDVSERVFVGADLFDATLLYQATRLVYHIIYLDGQTGQSRAKRFQLSGLRLNKLYHLFPLHQHSRILYFSKHANGEEERVQIYLSRQSSARKKIIAFDFGQLKIKNKTAGGNLVTKYPVKRITQQTVGGTTLGHFQLWYTPHTGALHTTQPTHQDHTYVGKFKAGTYLAVFYADGSYQLIAPQINLTWQAPNILCLTAWEANQEAALLYSSKELSGVYGKKMRLKPTTGSRWLPTGLTVQKLSVGNANSSEAALYLDGVRCDLSNWPQQQSRGKGKAIQQRWPADTAWKLVETTG